MPNNEWKDRKREREVGESEKKRGNCQLVADSFFPPINELNVYFS